MAVDVQVAFGLDTDPDRAVTDDLVNMWSKKPMPVFSWAWPLPSRFPARP